MVPVEVIPTNNWAIDFGCLRIGGFPRGRVTEIYGAESGGKTTLMLQACAAANKMGLAALIIDAVHALEPARALELGCTKELLAIYQPTSAEDALDLLYEECKLGEYAIIACDSAAALTPLKEMENSAADNTIGLQARLLSTNLRKIVPAASVSNTCVLFTNQLRTKIGVTFGNPNTTPGGNALKFYVSLRIEVTRIATNKEKDIPVSNRVRVKAVKNKLAQPYRQVEVDLIFGLGYDNKSCVFDAAVEAGLIKKKGSWFAWNDKNIGQGRTAAMDVLTDDDIKTLMGGLTCE